MSNEVTVVQRAAAWGIDRTNGGQSEKPNTMLLGNAVAKAMFGDDVDNFDALEKLGFDMSIHRPPDFAPATFYCDVCSAERGYYIDDDRYGRECVKCGFRQGGGE